MVYDEGLAQRIEDMLADQPGLVGKKMFGGIGYVVQGIGFARTLPPK